MKYNTGNNSPSYTSTINVATHRRRLYASLVIVLTIVGIISSWVYIDRVNLSIMWWGIISISLIIGLNWMYWTISELDKIIRSIDNEYYLLNEISTDLAHVKIIINCKKTATSDTPCDQCPNEDTCLNRK
jgi:hypothetical protein